MKKKETQLPPRLYNLKFLVLWTYAIRPYDYFRTFFTNSSTSGTPP